LQQIGSRRTGKRWVIELIKKLWHIAWDLWEHRNGILHKQNNISLEAKMTATKEKARKLYYMTSLTLAQTNTAYMLSTPLTQLLTRSLAYLEAWIAQTSQAIEVQLQMDLSRRRSVHWMRECLREWLIA
ncbi:MAG: hypothetical protein ACK53Y_06325, partial [bacterium]